MPAEYTPSGAMPEPPRDSSLPATFWRWLSRFAAQMFRDSQALQQVLRRVPVADLQAVVVDDGESVTISHGLGRLPLHVSATVVGGDGRAFVSAFNARTVTVQVETTPGGEQRQLLVGVFA